MNNSNNGREIISPEHQSEDHNNIRPKKIDDFIGQDNVKENLHISITACKQRNDHLDHVLLYGPPGLGKTTLANIIASELGVSIKTTAGPMIHKSGDLAAILSNSNPHDVLFIDEIHRLPTQIEEVLYPAMEDFKLDLIIGEGSSAKSISIDLNKFTLVAATTRMGLLSSPLRDRFGIILKLNFYSNKELKLVIARGARVLNTQITDDALNELSIRSRGTPRIALRLLKRVRDFSEVYNVHPIDYKITKEALNHLEIDNQGLDNLDRKYLKLLCIQYSGNAVGIDTIASSLSEHKNSIEEIIEPYLLQNGFIVKTARGRMATEKSFAHLTDTII